MYCFFSDFVHVISRYIYTNDKLFWIEIWRSNLGKRKKPCLGKSYWRTKGERNYDDAAHRASGTSTQAKGTLSKEHISSRLLFLVWMSHYLERIIIDCSSQSIVEYMLILIFFFKTICLFQMKLFSRIYIVLLNQNLINMCNKWSNLI